MPKFAYTAQTADGVVERGVEDAGTLDEAQLKLAARELRVTSLAAKRSLNVELTRTRVKRDDLMNLSRQLAAFLRAGIPILDAIAVLGTESDSAAVRRVMSQIGADLRAGSTFSEAVERFPRDFPPFYLGILRSAELTGRLDTVLDQLSLYLERDLEARRKVKGALVYPAVVAATSVVTVLILAVFVLPKFKDFFSSLDAQLPLPTRMLLAMTAFLGSWWWVVAAGLVALAGTYLVGVRTAGGRRLRDGLLLRVPAVGPTIRFAVVERFTRLLASLMAAGVPLPEAMTVATGSLRNLVFELPLRHARAQMIEGAGLAGPIAATGLFPGVMTQMIRVGEETGTLDTQLEVAAAYYERELDYKIKKLTTLIEPAVVLLMGLIVGFVAVALVSAMYGIFRTVNLT
jgi:type IV pilus assembly protein PilC